MQISRSPIKKTSASSGFFFFFPLKAKVAPTLLLLMVPTFPTSPSTSLAPPFVSSSDLILFLYSTFKPFDSLVNDPYSVCDGFEGPEICQRRPRRWILVGKQLIASLSSSWVTWNPCLGCKQMPMKALSTCNSVGDTGFGCASTDGDSLLTDVGLLQEIPSISVCVCARVCKRGNVYI